jgi:phosphohistidine phosphatase
MSNGGEMKTLYLLRHAKSSWDDPSLDDHDRPLATRGRKAAQLLAEELARQRFTVDLVICSSATRTRQTLQALLPALGPHIEVRFPNWLYGAQAAEIRDRLRRLDEAVGAVLVVGHNPGLQDLALDLVGDGERAALEQLRQKFPTGALATITTEMAWRGLGPSVGYLVSVVVPRLLEGS